MRLTAGGVELDRGRGRAAPGAGIAAEAFSRLVYGRLDPDHTPAFSGDGALLDALRAVFPGP